jgi:transcriptional regulator GlxA family with amidase domain
VNDGRFWTSAGVSAGIDLALALVAEDFGQEVARACAREVVVYYQRPGGQSQFSTIDALSDPRGRFAPLLAWIRGNLQEPLRVEELAARSCMSPRHFSRRFRAEVGCTPAQAVSRIRLEVARTLVEDTRRPIEAIARQSGFGDPETMRRAFVRSLGQSPRAVRTGARHPG